MTSLTDRQKNRREEIIEAALNIFYQKGFYSMKIEEVAQAAGTVSYTHLDVYKRQVTDHRFNEKRANMKNVEKTKENKQSAGFGRRVAAAALSCAMLFGLAGCGGDNAAAGQTGEGASPEATAAAVRVARVERQDLALSLIHISLLFHCR